jgi:hypothetical protein
MKKQFIEKESYNHKFAKNLLASWLRDLESKDDFCSLNPFNWRRNYGVFEELKFHKGDDLYYFECSDGVKQWDERSTNPNDYFYPDYNRGEILFVPDITIFHKGCPKILIEIVHTNSVSESKIAKINDFFGRDNIELYEVFADDVLSYCGQPDSIYAKKIL